ncbi:MAG: alpha/beta fold hydrolase [Myxococcota bacterium]|nr:alpha/beta fold hydrolase [Myxococcota bacterium]
MQDELIGSARAIANAWMDVAGIRPKAPLLAQTPRDEYPLEGGARLYRFAGPRTIARPILLVPSLINRWYVLDLRPGASLVEALAGAGFDVWLLDWGTPEAEDRYLDWDAVLRRLGRAARRVQRETQKQIAMLGYCMGGTLTTIHASQYPDLAALVTLAAPIDFSQGGMLRRMVDPSWFDADAVADAGNVAPSQMQAGFTALRPTLDAAKLVSMPELATDEKARAAFLALDEWASDNIPFPAEAYRRYIREMYQRNELVNGTHRANGKAAPLGAIKCPTLVITASRDSICPPPAATALLSHVGATDTHVLEVTGGHVGAVVGSKAAREMYPALIRWLAPRLA